MNPSGNIPIMYNQNVNIFPHNAQVSRPVFQQNGMPPPMPFQTGAQLNSQHVFGNSPRYPTPPQHPSQFIPNMNFITSTPPPMVPGPRPDQNLLNWKMPSPRDPSYPPPQMNTPQPPAGYSAPHQINGSFPNPANGFVNNRQHFSSPQPTFPQPSTSYIRPPAFQVHSLPGSRPPSQHTFQHQPQTMNAPRSFDQQPIRPSFQHVSHNNHNRNNSFQHQASSTNNSHYKTSNTGNNAFGSQPFNSYEKNHKRHNNYSNKNNRQNNRNCSFKNFQSIKKEPGDKNPGHSFSCDSCDRSFAAETDLKTHLSEHIKCDAGDCQFEAHPKIVYLHKKMQHHSGYAEKISKLCSQEEIEKWRAERRKRFPTQENIARRKAEQEEKEARGEVIETPESTGKMKRKGDHGFQEKSQPNKRRRHGNRDRNHSSLKFLKTPKTEVDDVQESESSDDEPVTKLAKFAGVNAVYSSETEKTSSNTEGLSPTSSSNLVVYDMSDDDAPIEISSKIKPVSQSPPSIQSSTERSCNQSSDKPVNNTQSAKKTKETNPKEDHDMRRKKREEFRERLPKKMVEPKRSTSLLKAIYADEIKSERNKMFQCIRYIVQNNFFGIGD